MSSTVAYLRLFPIVSLTWINARHTVLVHRLGNNAQTYILLANPQFDAANVQITFLRENEAPVTKSFTVQPRTRFNVAVAPGSPDVPELANGRFGAVIESTRPIIVERALYWDASFLTWSAGSNATATRLP